MPRAHRPLIAVLGSLALFLALTARVGDGALGWDTAVGDAVADVAPVASSDVHVDPFMEGITLAVGAATLAFGVWLVVRRRLRAAVFLGGAVVGSVAVSRIVKALVERPPIEGPPNAYSFPSGTATWSAATAVAIVVLALVRPRRERVVAAVAGAVLVLGLGAVIVWEQWHYPSDVLAGWSLGLGCSLLVWLVLGRPVDSGAETRRYSKARREERSAAAPSVPGTAPSGGTDTTA